MLNKFTLITVLIFSNLFITPISHATDSNQQIEEILALKEAPAGIVFEIVTGAANSLEWALPEIQNHIKELRARSQSLKFLSSLMVVNNLHYKLIKTRSTKKYIH